MSDNKILGITIPRESRQEVLEKIIKYISNPIGSIHILSINPENVVIAQSNPLFKKIVETAQMKIIDGIGIVLAAQTLNIKAGERYPGVELMQDMLKMASERRLRVLLIGGSQDLALELSHCYNRDYPEAKFKGIQGIKNIKDVKSEEEKAIFSIVDRYKPHIVFVAFGSPDQELFIERHKRKFLNSIVMGVGGSFDFLSGKVKRAPLLMQRLGLEWFFRLVSQPWRWKRQLRLFEFILLVIKKNVKPILRP